MADTRTLDERIRQQARDDLKKQIDAAAEPLLKMLLWSGNPVKGLARIAPNGSPVPIEAREVLRLLVAALNEELREKHEGGAVTAFIQRVESLQQQVDELRDMSHEH